MSEMHQPIKVVASRTGLSAHVIRIWEKRYGAVEPERTDTNRRLYSEEQIERLCLLRDITRNGHNIGLIAKLPLEKLRELSKEVIAPNGHTVQKEILPAGAPHFLDLCIDAVKRLDAHALDDTLKQAGTTLGSQGLLQRVVAPLAHTIGDLWRDGAITAAHEHFASAVIRIFLGQAAKSFMSSEGAPVIIVATPAGQIHELGALLVGAAAANLGWHVTYLGASLPAAEIVGAARQHHARAIALSIVYPEDDPRLEGELDRLHEFLPREIALLVGGRAMPAYQEILERIGAIQVKDLSELCSTLDTLRKPIKKATP